MYGAREGDVSANTNGSAVNTLLAADARDGAAAYRAQVSRAVEHTLLRRNGRRYAGRPCSTLDAWGPLHVSSSTPSSALCPRPPSEGAERPNLSSASAPPAPSRGGATASSRFVAAVAQLKRGAALPAGRPGSADVDPSITLESDQPRGRGGSALSAARELYPSAMTTTQRVIERDKNYARRLRLRRFLSQRRSVRGVGNNVSTAAPVEPPHPPVPPPRPLSFPLFVPGGTAQDVSRGRALMTSGPPAMHPWHALIHLGSSNFNDAPLESFMPVLSLSSSDAPASCHALPSCVEVHLADVEATRFRVEVPSSLYTSPIRPLLKSFGSCTADGVPYDGSLFFITPLFDDDAELGEAGAAAATPAHSPALRPRQTTVASAAIAAATGAATGSYSGRVASTALLPSSLEPRPSVTAHLAPPSPPAPPARSPHKHYVEPDHSIGTGSTVAPVATAGPALDGALDLRRTVTSSGAGLGAERQQHVPLWRRYSTAAALYLCMAQAGVCDADSLPFLSVHLLPCQQLLAGCEVRVELIGSCSPTTVRRLRERTKSLENVPVALSVPVARKGVLRALPSSRGALPSIATQPFTDAELFQMFYLQLLFRASFDVRFPDMTWRDASGGGACLRSDRLGSVYCEKCSLAFEHPSKPNAWLLFPARSRLLAILDLEHAVIPLYASPRDLQRSAHTPLFGSTPDVPCQTGFGRDVVNWASTQQVQSPRTAYQALEELFSLFAARYGCTRTSVWNAAAPPRVFRCSERVAFEAMREHCAKLSRFFVPETGRSMGADAASARQALAPRDVPFLASSSSRQLSRLPSVLHDLPRPAVASVCASQDLQATLSGPSFGAAVVAFQQTQEESVVVEEEDRGRQGSVGAGGLLVVPPAAPGIAMEHSHTVPLGASFSVLDVPEDYVARSTLHTPFVQSVVHPPPNETAPCEPSTSTKAALPLSPDAKEQQDEEMLDRTVGAASPFTKQESLVTRWRYYAHEGSISIFDGVTTGIELQGFLGRGGSGLVYRGRYGQRGLPVAVKVFIIPDGMEHENYVRESLTDVAFYVLMNQLDDFGVCNTCRAHDFIVSAVAPRGLPEADANAARRNRDPATTPLCYLVTDLMDGTLGRFLTEEEDDYDPCYDTIINSPLRDGELFHFLFVQLAIKGMFDWKVLDLMLNNQLRGDNVGYRYVDLTAAKRAEVEADPNALAEALLARNYYKGIIVAFQSTIEEPMRYVRFTSDLEAAYPDMGPLRFVYFIDLGQGIQPNVSELTRNHFIGETVVDSCVEDDGFGRYWPLNELYCRYVDVKGTLADDVIAWGSQVRLNSQDDAVSAMTALLELYYPTYGISPPSQEELRSHMVFTWSPSVVGELKKAYVYRPGPM